MLGLSRDHHEAQGGPGVGLTLGQHRYSTADRHILYGCLSLARYADFGVLPKLQLNLLSRFGLEGELVLRFGRHRSKQALLGLRRLGIGAGHGSTQAA